MPLFTLYTGPHCTLCDDLSEQLDILQDSVPFEYQKVNIRDPDQLEARRLYQYDIPVLTLDSAVVMKHRYSENLIKQAIEKWQNQQKNLA